LSTITSTWEEAVLAAALDRVVMVKVKIAMRAAITTGSRSEKLDGFRLASQVLPWRENMIQLLLTE
jgi:hypothetical protein